MRNAFVNAIYKLAEKDDRIVLLTGDLGFKLFENFASRFPGRFINAGIAETNMITVAAGMAMEGFKPFVYSITPFVTVKCLEQIRNDLAYHGSNVVIVGIGSGFSYGFDGPSHFAVEDIAVLRPIPGIKIVCPADPVETEAVMRWIGNNDSGPLYLRLGKSDPVIHCALIDFELDIATTLCPGKDVVILSTGNMLGTAVKVSELLAINNDIGCRVISVPTIKPFNKDIVNIVASEYSHIVTLEEHSVVGGFGSAVAEYLMEIRHQSLLYRFAIPDRIFNEVGDQKYLREQAHLSAESVYMAILEAKFFKHEMVGE
jgi:transketolase